MRAAVVGSPGVAARGRFSLSASGSAQARVPPAAGAATNRTAGTNGDLLQPGNAAVHEDQGCERTPRSPVFG
ncbi:MAG TPA: hypothetical protein VKZ81_10895 [Pseudonocardia sp.]|uniref:hypothetical protein n=1 Tax=Pseudonocardia sp. TaxID=60912 RepID=UPI002B4B39D2|nr:hypothetical protein [Pseudonocardia sp.]HLU55957.1 hypothetical protein [Pseudonocardia sp.]